MRRRPFRAFTVRLDPELAQLLDRAQEAQAALHSRDAFEPPQFNMSDVVRRALKAEARRVLAR